MATANGIFNIKLEQIPFTAATITAGTTDKYPAEAGDYQYTTAEWDVAVHEVTWNVNPTFIENSDELRGYTSMPWHDGAGSMAVELTAKARVRPRMLGLLCYMATGGKRDGNGLITTGGVTTITSGVGDHGTYGDNQQTLAASEYQHLFLWSDGDVPCTGTIRFAPTKGDGWYATGCGLSTLAFSFEDSGAMVADMTFRGLYFGSAAEMADITPAYETDVPLKKSNFKFVGDDIFSATTSKATDVNFAIDNNLSNFFSFGANSIWPDAIEYEDLWARVSGSVTKRQVLAADYTRWTGKGEDEHFLECIQGQGDFLHAGSTSGTRFAFYVHLPAAQWMAMNPEAITNKRRIGVSFDWEARTDANGTGNFCDMYVVNLENSTAYTTFS